LSWQCFACAWFRFPPRPLTIPDRPRPRSALRWRGMVRSAAGASAGPTTASVTLAKCRQPTERQRSPPPPRCPAVNRNCLILSRILASGSWHLNCRDGLSCGSSVARCQSTLFYSLLSFTAWKTGGQGNLRQILTSCAPGFSRRRQTFRSGTFAFYTLLQVKQIEMRRI
jgi:hypothetical protein